METGHIILVTGQIDGWIDIDNTAVHTTPRAVLANIKLPSLSRTHTPSLAPVVVCGVFLSFSSMLFFCWIFFPRCLCWTFFVVVVAFFIKHHLLMGVKNHIYLNLSFCLFLISQASDTTTAQR